MHVDDSTLALLRLTLIENVGPATIARLLARAGSPEAALHLSAAEMQKSISSSGKVAIYGILFDFNKADIKPESAPTLAEMAALLKAEPNLKVLVVGHTDNVGGMEYNTRLSKGRARSVHELVVSELKAKGVPDQVIDTQVLPFAWYSYKCAAVPYSKHDPNKVSKKLKDQEKKLRDDENEPNRRIEINQYPDETVKCYVPLPPQQ
mgnify:CR=1 FL=1